MIYLISQIFLLKNLQKIMKNQYLVKVLNLHRGQGSDSYKSYILKVDLHI